ncbi:GNAT family N-acetyltransferase [Bradyrhizobium sp.]|jgi:RimJ/RimL family protein N-acetyltransferase|uniref:GNAT family N-acetyltransferase n=1 Tax=Bradyrhizobium sp. TaxID=376 RepID=UPI003C488C2E
MTTTVREMTDSEFGIVIDYFFKSTPEHLETLGVDPTRLPTPDSWRERFQRDRARPIEQRASLVVIWLGDNQPLGFSTSDKIAYGEQANMHLHVVDPERRNRGYGAECVRQSADIYFERLKLKRLFCEPNAFNVAPNRTLQKAGFKYLKTHMTVPGPLNFHQAVTRWVMERQACGRKN